MSADLYIFDLDGTIAKIDHRRHFVEGPNKNWDAFYRACVNDTLNMPVFFVLQTLAQVADIFIFSGRSEVVRRETEQWLRRHGIRYADLLMRAEGDFTSDEHLKRSWYEDLSPYNTDRLVAVFDDRDKVVRMWRDIGVPCFQVAPGAF